MRSISRWRHHFGFNRLDKPFLKEGLPNLSSEEKKQIKKAWPGLDISELDYIWPRIFKEKVGFSPYFLGDLWVEDIEHIVNPQNQLVSLENKALCDVYFPELNFPEPYVRCLNGICYDRDMNHISVEEATNLLCEKGQYIIKPSVGTMQGKGVRKVSANKGIDIKTIFRVGGGNFIAQEVLKQLPLIEQLNPTSLNCFRITSIYINGRFDYTTILKVGKKGAERDNWNSSILMGIDKNGCANKVGYDYQLNQFDRTDSGFVLSDIVVPEFDKLTVFVEKYHKKYFPNCGIIGWDITIDEKGAIRVIETNLTAPGLQAEQLCSGDFLKPFCKDINEIILNKL